jgi:hypothetical protein
MLVGAGLLKAALDTQGSVDSDVKEALEALIRTQRTRESGLYYDTRPQNPIAASIQSLLQEHLDQIQKELTAEPGGGYIRDADLLGIFVFLQRLEIQHNNSRRLGRAFIDFLRQNFPQPEGEARSSPLIVT